MNHLVAANKPTPHPLARNFLKPLAAALAAAVCLAGHALAAGTNSVTLAWDPNPETNIAGYRLQYGTTAGVYPKVVDAGNSTSITASGLHQGTTYYFAVVAYNTMGQSSAASAAVEYTVPGSPNTAPTADGFSLTVAEDGQVAATLSGADEEGDLLDYSIVSSPAKGTLTGTPPNLTYRPSANATGSDSFTFRAGDGLLDSASATVSITITPVNDHPVADAKVVTVPEDGQLAIPLTGSDVDGDSLAYSVVTVPAKGTLTGTPPNLTYRPGANLTGSDSFTYRVNDGTADSAAATVTITISPVNDVPVATPRSLSVPEDTPLSVALAGTDVEGSALGYAVVAAPAGGSLSGSAPNLTYTPAANFHGSDSFTFRVNDGTANSANALVSITVTPVNDAPLAVSRTATTQPNTPVAITVSGTDVEGSPLSYALVTGPANGTLSGTAPHYTYAPTPGFEGNDSFTFRVHDGALNSGNATVSISVATPNRAPQAHGKSLTTMKNKAVDVALSGTDADADALSFRVVNGPADGSLTGTPPNLRYTPAAKWTGNDQFTYVVNDGKVDSSVATVNLKVKSANQKPVASAGVAWVNQNTAATITVAGNDADGDALSFAVVKGPLNGSISGTGPDFIYVPNSGFKGKDRFSFITHDGTAGSTAAVVEIIVVNPNNRAPVAIAQGVSGPARKAVAIRLQGTDADNDPLTFRVVALPASGKLTGKGGNLKFKPAAAFSGTVSFTYVANDGAVDSAPATVTITIAPPVTAARTIAAKTKGGTSSVGGADVPTLAIGLSSAGTLKLTVTGSPGARYALEHSGDLTGWAEIQSIDLPDTGAVELELAVPAGSKRGYFRLNTP